MEKLACVCAISFALSNGVLAADRTMLGRSPVSGLAAFRLPLHPHHA